MGFKRETSRAQGAWAAALVAILSPTMGWGLALRTSRAEMVFEDLRIGRTYSVAELLGGPFKVINSGNEAADIEMKAALPEGHELKDGYEPVPLASWIKVTGRGRALEPGQEAAGNAVIAIPNDRRLLGGQYQAQWVSDATSASGLRLSLGSRVLLHVGPDAGALEALRRKIPKRQGLAFLIGAGERKLRGVALGRRVELKREHGIALKLINPNETAITLALRPQAGGHPPLRVEEGFAPAVNAQFLKLERQALEVPAGSVAEVKMSLEIPDQKRYRQRRWTFTVAVELLDASEPKVEYYQLYVETR